jgi:Ni/Co efflux regulator RcnB
MKKLLITIAAVAAIACSTLAQAQNTAQAWQFRKDTCTAVAGRSVNAFQYREAKEPYPFHTMSPMTSKPMHMWAIHFAMNEAGSAEEAFKVSYAMCLDNVDAVYRAARYGQEMTEAQLK